MLRKLLSKFAICRNIPEPPYEYDFLKSLEQQDYPKYLAKIYEYKTGKKLNLKNPKTYNEKIQWLKLYDATPLKTRLTDKVLVRDWVNERIGEKYLKPVLWIGESFDEIPFDTLPESFIIKCNHGCKWQFKIKKKTDLLKNTRLLNALKFKFDTWLGMSFAFCAGFELQYNDIQPRILIEELLEGTIFEFEVNCFNGIHAVSRCVNYLNPYNTCFIDSDFNIVSSGSNTFFDIDAVKDKLREAVDLSKILAENFKLVRVDWMLVDGKLYFNEMTFTPHSGYSVYPDDTTDLELGKLLKL